MRFTVLLSRTREFKTFSTIANPGLVFELRHKLWIFYLMHTNMVPYYYDWGFPRPIPRACKDASDYHREVDSALRCRSDGIRRYSRHLASLGQSEHKTR